jgi:hypothetical protein
MNSKQQGQGSAPAGKDPRQQSQSGTQDQQGGREAAQRKDFDKLMSESDQQVRDESMQQGGGSAHRGGKQSR